MPEPEKKRVPIFVFPETRDKLNLLKDHMRRKSGKTVFLDEALNELIDCHPLEAASAARPRRRAARPRRRAARQPVPTP